MPDASLPYTPVQFPGCAGGKGNGSFIVMEYLNFGGNTDAAALGKQLALMHLATPLVSW